ncbi:iron-containing alcohol dehydrogenase [Clostridiaceae bacterium M8S5]|nr:iron-containing alcohol dehydrogenase [Clostridiaceae bacterium M8S5]
MSHFEIVSKVEAGVDSLKEIQSIVSNYSANNILLITDKGVRAVGLVDKVLENIDTTKHNVLIFDEVMPNPTDTMIESCVNTYKDQNIDLIIAVGGGSAIDSSKAINVLLSNSGQISDYEGMNKVKNETLPLIAIPTTAGTASEVTGVSVITDTKRKVKMVIGGINVNADFAIVDPTLTLGLPPSITASTGMDALTHALESYVSKFATVFTDTCALRAIELISNNIEEAVHNGKNIVARENMINASVLAGFAFNCAVLGLVHGIAHPLGAHFNVPHGIANAIMLPYVVEYNAPFMGSKLENIGKAMNIDGDITAEKVVAKIKELNDNIKIPSLSDTGVKESDIDLIADATMKEPSLFMNPREVKIEEVKDILLKALSDK